MIFKLGELVQAIFKDKIVEGKVLRQDWRRTNLKEPSFYYLESLDNKELASPTTNGFPAEQVFKLDKPLFTTLN